MRSPHDACLLKWFHSTCPPTNMADGEGHAQGLFNVAYLPKEVALGLARSSVLISAQAVLPDGTTAGITTIRFAAQR
jgi:hypothetical protein